MLPLTVCIIGKNEENNIERCIQSLLNYNLEIQYTDTGSTDGTLAVIAKYPVQISYFDWCDDFSAARNFCISHASNDWILSLDCDECVKHIDTESLLDFMCTSPASVGRIKMFNHYLQDGAVHDSEEHIGRLFHREYYAFKGSIHEQLSPIKSHSISSSAIPVQLEHFGYIGDAAFIFTKANRNIELLQNELSKAAPTAYLYFQLGQSYFMMSNYKEAIRYFEQGLTFDVTPTDDYVLMMVESYGYCLIYTEQYEKALQFSNIYESFSFHADFVFLMGLIYMYNCMFGQAILELQNTTKLSNYTTVGVNTYLANYNIGVIYEITKNIPSAIFYYELALHQGYEPARLRLSTLDENH